MGEYLSPCSTQVCPFSCLGVIQTESEDLGWWAWTFLPLAVSARCTPSSSSAHTQSLQHISCPDETVNPLLTGVTEDMLCVSAAQNFYSLRTITLNTKFKWHQERRYIEILKGIFQFGFQSKISTEFPHDLCMTQPVLLSLSKSIVLLHILSKGRELCPGRGAPLARGLPEDQLPPAEGAHEPRRVQGPRVPPDPERQTQGLWFHRTFSSAEVRFLRQYFRTENSTWHSGTTKSVLHFSSLELFLLFF